MSKTIDIHHQVGIKANIAAVFQTLTDTKKLAQWWTSDTRGSGAKTGGILEFWFGDFCQKFEVKALETDRLVVWKGLDGGMDDWTGTEISFKLTQDGEQTWVRFKHSGWKEEGEFMSHCSTKWAVFMLSLKDLLETGKGRPAPNDIPINHD